MSGVDHRLIDWSGVSRSAYLVEQSFRYEYPEPVRELRQRLLVIPPSRFGDQRRLDHCLEVLLPGAEVGDRVDRFGNVVMEVYAPRVESSIEFTARVRVQREAGHLNRLRDGWLGDGYLLEPTRLTVPDTRIQRAAERLAADSAWGLPLADRINDWVYQSMTYQADCTGVKTTAAQALTLGRGVCQDYAHVMLAVCRACRLPARYVSGHLVGEGGSHAWVEVLLPTEDGTGDALAWSFDPTHAGRGGLNYVTIAVGGDYADVAPTSGSYVAAVQGRLSSRKRVSLTQLDYAV